ncbi:MAG: nitroreductase family protein [Thermoplasmata archaeon]
MSGITFFRTGDLERIKDFYINEIGMSTWVDQGSCIILKHGNMLLGFCEGDDAETEGVVTFFYDEKERVDEMYDKLKDRAKDKPKENSTYNIYNFFAEDPDRRSIEFQTFMHDLEPYLDGEELLLRRRSIRDYEEKEIDKDTLWKLFELCRWAPTSMNSESYYFVPIHDRDVLEKLGTIRGASSQPISNAPMAVAICSDPGKTKRKKQDGCIAAYHFMLAAKLFGLGTCWIADMDRDEVKELIEVPKEHYVATVTPLGYPVSLPDAPERDPVEDYVKKPIE